MATELPNLDNRTFDDLVEEARGAIPHLYRGWTDHNPSDPGMTLVELFAWLTEMVLYRTNRVTDKSYEVFLRVLRSDPTFSVADGEALSAAIQETIGRVRGRYRAVTAEDYEALVREQHQTSVERVRCFAERDLDPFTGELRRPGHMSVVLVTTPVDFYRSFDAGYTEAHFHAAQQASFALRETVRGQLNSRRILTTRLHVVGPSYLVVPVKATLFLREGFARAQVEAAAIAALQRYFHPLYGGQDEAGWPFGRPVYVSDLYSLLDALPGVDFVEDIDLPVAAVNRTILDEEGALVGVDLLEHELARIDVGPSSLTVRERAGGVWL